MIWQAKELERQEYYCVQFFALLTLPTPSLILDILKIV